MEQPIDPKEPKSQIEVEVRKKKRTKKRDRVKFNLTFEEKDVKIFFN